jgi:SNF2 family DNA or RNA helicase
MIDWSEVGYCVASVCVVYFIAYAAVKLIEWFAAEVFEE